MDPTFKMNYKPSRFVFYLMEILSVKQITLFFEALCKIKNFTFIEHLNLNNGPFCNNYFVLDVDDTLDHLFHDLPHSVHLPPHSYPCQG